MLSFFRSKPSEGTAINNIISATENLSIEEAELATQHSTLHSTAKMNEYKDPNDLLKSLGYQNKTELQETIYGAAANS